MPTGSCGREVYQSASPISGEGWNFHKPQSVGLSSRHDFKITQYIAGHKRS